MKYYVILQECFDPFYGANLYENVVYTTKEEAEKRIKEISSVFDVWIEEVDVK